MVSRIAQIAALLPLTLGAFLPPAVFAEDGLGEAETETSEPRRFLDVLTVTATRSERAVEEVAGTVSVIGRDRIEAQAMTGLEDLVRYEPGVDVEGSAGQGGLGGFVIRGVGGNRVLTRIDGVPIAEQFEFGHFEVPSFALPVESLENVEILRGASSSLYGSDALGGVVSLVTRDPRDFLSSGRGSYFGLQLGWDARNEAASESLTWARAASAWQVSLSVDHRAGAETANQGEVATENTRRTAPDPQESRGAAVIGKLVHDGDPSREWKLGFELLDRRAETRVLSAQGTTNLGAIFGFPPSITYLVDKPSVEAVDEQNRWRVSLERSATGGWTDHLLWRTYAQSSRTEQESTEIRATTRGGGPFGDLATSTVRRDGLMRFEQSGVGGELQGRRGVGSHLITFGASLGVDRFDQLRDRPETDLATGQVVPSSDGLIFPTRYFPESRVLEGGLFGQAELRLAGGRVLLTPGLRYDRLDLGIDENDEIFLAGNLGTEPPVEVHEEALSPKLGLVVDLGGGLSMRAQVARGFRAPPYSAVNSGFTHLAGGQTRLPNPELRPETSDSYELGLRGSLGAADLSVGLFQSEYDDFIELIALGLNPSTGLSEFQQRNVTRARIRGVEAALELELSRNWKLMTAGAWIEGEDRTARVPLDSIHPPQLVIGLSRQPLARPWRMEIVGRWVAAKDANDLDNRRFDQFQSPAYEVLDLFGGWRVSERLSINAAVLNLFDETYWSWAGARGQRESSSVLNRFTEPGRKAVVSLRFRHTAGTER